MHCTSSGLEDVLPQILACIDAGMNVVSTCEELSFPWFRSGSAAAAIAAAAERRGVTVLGTGVSLLGFAMDFLPLVLSGSVRRVEHVAVHRTQDAGQRRLPLQRKVGAGLTELEFRKGVDRGSIRHVGLPESAEAIAAAFGWTPVTVAETIEPVLSGRDVQGPDGVVAAGAVLGIRQTAIARAQGREVVSLLLEMALGLDPCDRISLTGDPDVQLEVPNGLHWDSATAAVVANSIPGVLQGRPGLPTMKLELPPPVAGPPFNASLLLRSDV